MIRPYAYFALGRVFFCLVFLLPACGPVKAPAPPAGKTAAAPVKPSYAAEAEKLNAGIEHGLTLIGKQPGDTLLPLQVVSLYQERARLTGNYGDYAKAEALLAGLPGKAAAFERPILAAEGHLMGQRVKQYGVGLTVPENDVEQNGTGE